ncbi:unnamed protein product [Rotaria magnacalcarata]
MQKLGRKKSRTRQLNYGRSIKSIKSNDTETFSSEDEKILFHPDEDIDDINFSNGSVLNDISDLFTFCKEQINTRFISVLIYKVDQRLVRSVESCKLDLRRFGAKFTANSSRPYFLGHERENVVKHRKEFVKYLIEREQHFYMITNDTVPQWKTPITTPTILLCHDKSTYKCGEIPGKRWIMSDNAPFYNKGRGRSIMCSDLLVMHPSGPFFSLTDKEYSEALKKIYTLK